MCYLTLSSYWKERKGKTKEKKQTLDGRNWADTCNQASEAFLFIYFLTISVSSLEAALFLAAPHVTLLKDNFTEYSCQTNALRVHGK